MTLARVAALGAALGFAASVLASCGKPASGCPTTCAGCCDASGACQTGQSSSACGHGASTCAVCPSGQSCSSAGACVAATGGGSGGGAGGGSGGGAATGGGVEQSGCFASNVYISPPLNAVDTECGALGVACVDCAQTSKACDGQTHTCVAPPNRGFDGGTGGATGGGTGGATGGGTGGASGGGTGGAPSCDGCRTSVAAICVPLANTSVINCGVNGSTCQSCKSGEQCTNGVCTAPAGPTPGSLGTGCQRDSDCAAMGVGHFCKLTAVPGGQPYPQGMCTRRCTSQADCGSSNVCTYWLGFQGEVENICLRGCASGSCRPGYDCVDVSVSTTPRPACIPSTLAAFDAGPGTSAAAGGPCTRDSQCGPAPYFSCTPERNASGAATGYAGGSCTADCSLTLSDAWCGDGGICLPFVITADRRGALVQWSCSQGCTPGATPSGCRAGYVCQDFGAGSGACTPDCRQAPSTFCGSATCSSTTGLCG